MKDLMGKNLSRRTFLGVSSGVAAVAGLGLVGCGGGSGGLDLAFPAN